MWEVPAPLHPLEFRLQRILPDNGVMSAATIRPRCALSAPDANRSPEARSSTGGTMVNDNRGWPGLSGATRPFQLRPRQAGDYVATSSMRSRRRPSTWSRDG